MGWRSQFYSNAQSVTLWRLTLWVVSWHWPLFLLSLVAQVLTIVTTTLVTVETANIFDDPDLERVWRIVKLVVVGNVAGYVSGYLRGVIFGEAQMQMCVWGTWMFLRQRVPWQLPKETWGMVEDQLSDLPRLGLSVFPSIVSIVTNLVLGLWFASALQIPTSLLLAAIVPDLALALVGVLEARKSRKFAIETTHKHIVFQTTLARVIEQLPLARGQRAIDFAEQQVLQVTATAWDAKLRRSHWMSIFFPIIKTNIALAKQFARLYLGVTLLLSGELTVGKLVIVGQLMSLVSGAVTRMVSVMIGVSSLKGRLRDVMVQLRCAPSDLPRGNGDEKDSWQFPRAFDREMRREHGMTALGRLVCGRQGSDARKRKARLEARARRVVKRRSKYARIDRERMHKRLPPLAKWPHPHRNKKQMRAVGAMTAKQRQALAQRRMELRQARAAGNDVAVCKLHKLVPAALTRGGKMSQAEAELLQDLLNGDSSCSGSLWSTSDDSDSQDGAEQACSSSSEAPHGPGVQDPTLPLPPPHAGHADHTGHTGHVRQSSVAAADGGGNDTPRSLQDTTLGLPRSMIGRDLCVWGEAMLNPDVQWRFRLEPGSLTLLTGANGVGKSTLLRTLAGERFQHLRKEWVDAQKLELDNMQWCADHKLPQDLTLRDSPPLRATLGGYDLLDADGATLLDEHTRGLVSSAVAFMPQSNELVQGTLLDNVWLRRDEPAPRAKDLQGFFDRHHFPLGPGRTWPEGLNTRVGPGMRVSGGESQRVALARVVLRQDASLLLLDEPLASLDVKSVAWLLAWLAAGQAKHRAGRSTPRNGRRRSVFRDAHGKTHAVEFNILDTGGLRCQATTLICTHRLEAFRDLKPDVLVIHANHHMEKMPFERALQTLRQQTRSELTASVRGDGKRAPTPKRAWGVPGRGKRSGSLATTTSSTSVVTLSDVHHSHDDGHSDERKEPENRPSAPPTPLLRSASTDGKVKQVARTNSLKLAVIIDSDDDDDGVIAKTDQDQATLLGQQQQQQQQQQPSPPPPLRVHWRTIPEVIQAESLVQRDTV